jgi:hypothetical protein
LKWEAGDNGNSIVVLPGIRVMSDIRVDIQQFWLFVRSEFVIWKFGFWDLGF